MSAKEVSRSSLHPVSRRGLAKLAGLGALAGVAGAAGALAAGAAAAAPGAADGETTGYRVTPHIETYYKLARF
ncbi:formate dehydrogenase region TAT target [Tistlia consotensis]|uniref:Formate dehydrogenase region TAT target n=1 Tax=Tistlia consotensis USBA 355 TaxID=560819 RepID=A0A1Y6CCA0_9PROT|nr:hypothetical protein [Tistlia consotensis]SMF55602.1 formate dehydrogenase region TAT target [Tistlia consotensis USBA 355]SNR88802.1 formate dehydrogenase region TAT target [Tistlia consotensis]